MLLVLRGFVSNCPLNFYRFTNTRQMEKKNIKLYRIRINSYLVHLHTHLFIISEARKETAFVLCNGNKIIILFLSLARHFMDMREISSFTEMNTSVKFFAVGEEKLLVTLETGRRLL